VTPRKPVRRPQRRRVPGNFGNSDARFYARCVYRLSMMICLVIIVAQLTGK
jgi:hypothetical protein